VLAGNGLCHDSGDGGPATDAGIQSPYSATYDPQGNLYVATHSFIRKIVPSGIISTFAGARFAGTASDGVQTTQAAILPVSIASDTAGNISVVDSRTSSIRKIALDGTISTFAKYDSLVSNLPIPFLELAIDRLGDLFFAYGNTVRKFAPDGTSSTVVTGISVNSMAVAGAGALYLGGDSIVYHWRQARRRPW
jgi:hypothetical protein